MSGRWVAVADPDTLAAFPGYGAGSGFGPADLRRHACDAHWLLLDAGQRPLAHCSLWWSAVPRFAGERVGAIGHYGAADPAAGRATLEHACRQLVRQGCSLAVGPMDGNTWRRYRLTTASDPEPPFWLEPGNPPDWPDHFRRAGFQVIARYRSAVVDDLARLDPGVDASAAAAAAGGFSVRTLAAADYDGELDRIYRLAVEGFAGNFFYAAITRDEFCASYAGVRPLVDPRLVFFAEQDGEPVGFLFCLPDPAAGDSGAGCRRVVFKSMAVIPRARRHGLATLLLGTAQRTARELGFGRAVHALMHTDGHTSTISKRNARTFRRYALFGQRLAARTP